MTPFCRSAFAVATLLFLGSVFPLFAAGEAAAAAAEPGLSNPKVTFVILAALAGAAWHFRAEVRAFLLEARSLAVLSARLRRASFWMAVALLAVVAFLFHHAGNSTWNTKFGASLFNWLWIAWRDPIYDSSHGPLVPLISLGLLWWNRKAILKLPAVPDARGLFSAAFALLVHWMGMRGQIPRASVLALILLLWSMVWCLQGLPRARAMAFPIAFLVFMIPMNFLETLVAFPMRLMVTKASTGIGQALGIAVMRDGTRIFDATGAYQYDVAPACSGIRSLTAIVMLSLIYGYVTQRRLWKKAVLCISGLPLTIAGNIVRITSIILAAQCFGQEAGNVVHEWFGFLIFLVVVLLLVGVSRLINADYAALARRFSAALARVRTHPMTARKTPSRP
ncbi:MAG: exosortase/archaeosortase family protein [Verrucomicrobiae bacterium]|nr:exosortase/archaeosortase family protein [Verrucomicrobiae bacterium]